MKFLQWTIIANSLLHYDVQTVDYVNWTQHCATYLDLLKVPFLDILKIIIKEHKYLYFKLPSMHIHVSVISRKHCQDKILTEPFPKTTDKITLSVLY